MSQVEGFRRSKRRGYAASLRGFRNQHKGEASVKTLELVNAFERGDLTRDELNRKLRESGSIAGFTVEQMRGQEPIS